MMMLAVFANDKHFLTGFENDDDNFLSVITSHGEHLLLWEILKIYAGNPSCDWIDGLVKIK